MRLVAGLLGSVCLAACSPSPDRDSASGDIVTVYGAIGAVDRANVDAITEPLFGTLGVEFQTALGLNYESLATLQQHTIRTDFPAGGEMRQFSGPLLRDVLAVAIPDGDLIRVTALDGYQRDIERSRVQAHDVILAISADGKALGLGGWGPTMLVWPRGADPELAEMPDDDWVWGILTIEVR